MHWARRSVQHHAPIGDPGPGSGGIRPGLVRIRQLFNNRNKKPRLEFSIILLVFPLRYSLGDLMDDTNLSQSLATGTYGMLVLGVFLNSIVGMIRGNFHGGGIWGYWRFVGMGIQKNLRV